MEATRPEVPQGKKAVSTYNKLKSGWDTQTTFWESGQFNDCSQKAVFKCGLAVLEAKTAYQYRHVPDQGTWLQGHRKVPAEFSLISQMLPKALLMTDSTCTIAFFQLSTTLTQKLKYLYNRGEIGAIFDHFQ